MAPSISLALTCMSMAANKSRTLTKPLRKNSRHSARIPRTYRSGQPLQRGGWRFFKSFRSKRKTKVAQVPSNTALKKHTLLDPAQKAMKTLTFADGTHSPNNTEPHLARYSSNDVLLLRQYKPNLLSNFAMYSDPHTSENTRANRSL